eukprot:CAMPEP_0180797288 /NCGR_PEP_ID=MMETSP1038_2-20121128/57288_1 /TAXON_ID=632150 /ORGANISM="Azadinium spinosum, Strain 3D9" /LENGTH=191 /DNA_ID=CAMNT_0022836535 /DNA_START=39 /DNA_END=610 /DNA_ORIENTATION=+
MTFVGLAKAGFYEDAGRVFRRLASIPDLANRFAYNMMIGIHCKRGDMESALEVMNSMEDRGFDADGMTYRLLLEGHMQQQRWERRAGTRGTAEGVAWPTPCHDRELRVHGGSQSRGPGGASWPEVAVELDQGILDPHRCRRVEWRVAQGCALARGARGAGLSYGSAEAFPAPHGCEAVRALRGECCQAAAG